MEPVKSAGVIVYREENDEHLYLLLHYPAGHWDLPKGHIEKAEEPRETALRELKEETGISIIAIHPDFQETINYIYEWKEQKIPKEVIFFLGKTPIKDVVLSKEHTGFEWLPGEEAEKKATYDNAKALIKKAEKALK